MPVVEASGYLETYADKAQTERIAKMRVGKTDRVATVLPIEIEEGAGQFVYFILESGRTCPCCGNLQPKPEEVKPL